MKLSTCGQPTWTRFSSVAFTWKATFSPFASFASAWIAQHYSHLGVPFSWKFFSHHFRSHYVILVHFSKLATRQRYMKGTLLCSFPPLACSVRLHVNAAAAWANAVVVVFVRLSKRRTNKIGIRAWNEKYALWLGFGSLAFCFVLHLNSATKTHISKHKMMVLLECFMYTFFFSYKMLWLWFNAYFKSVKIWVLRFIRLLPLHTTDVCAGRFSQERKVCGGWCVQGTQVDAMKRKKRLFDVWSTGSQCRNEKKVIQTSFSNGIFFFLRESINRV